MLSFVADDNHENGASSVVNDIDPLVVADNNENDENRTVGDGQEENLIEKDSDTRRGEDERKPSQEESCSQSKWKNKEKKASKGTGSAQNDTERKETENKERSSSAGTMYLTVLLVGITSFTVRVSSISVPGQVDIQWCCSQ